VAVAITRNVWQVSGGPITRSYADVFLKYGVALIGPGDAGEWRPELSDDEFEGSYVRRFASEVIPRDIFLLRVSQASIQAVGVVDGGYQYLPQFDDVNGWDLQHARRVHWSRLPDEYKFDELVFGANPPRISKVGNATVLDYAYRFIQSPPVHWQTAPLPKLPEEEPPLDEVPIPLQGLVAQAHDLFSFYWNQQAFGEHPTEDELIAHFVVPLLRALGWQVEQIAIKWKRVDVCVFRSLPRNPENCHLVIEAKRLGAGVEGALEQAKRYLVELGVTRDIVVTDGIRYRMYKAENDFAPEAYANLYRLKSSALKLFEHMRRPLGGE